MTAVPLSLPLPADLSRRIEAAGLDADALSRLVAAAVEEDLGGGADVTTTATIGRGRGDTGDILVKEKGVVAGLLVAEVVFWQVGSGELTVAPGSLEGQQVESGTVALTVSGPTRRLLTAERVALNFVRHLSGVATLTRRFVDAVTGTGAVILDTRKTTPMLRALEKYAVRCGGGTNHRMSLSDMALIKDNHVLAAGGVRQAMERVRAAASGVLIEIEVTSLAMAREAVDAGADSLLLDNMTPAQMAECVAAVGDRADLEASGGITLATVRAIAESGVDFISVGSLTHSAPNLDVSLDLRG